MTSLNSVELIGRVGTINVTERGDSKFAKISLATNEIYRTKNGCLVEEATWTLLTCYQNKSCRDLSEIAKGDILHVKGRLRNIRFTGADGIDRTQTEELCSFWEKMEEE